MRLITKPLCFFAVSVFGALPALSADNNFSTRHHVGQISTNSYYTPANQILTPFGKQVELPGMRPQAIALSPDGKLLVTAGKTHELVVLDPVTGSNTTNSCVLPAVTRSLPSGLNAIACGRIPGNSTCLPNGVRI